MALKDKLQNKKLLYSLAGALVVILIIGGTLYYLYTLQSIYIDKSEIVASEIDLSPTIGGPLQEVMVKAGDQVSENEVVARVGDELIKAKSAGIVINVNDNIGMNFTARQTVVAIIDPNNLRVVGHLDEDKGLADVRIGQSATFIVDAYGSKKYLGVVDEISELPSNVGVVFSISDKRAIKQYDIKVRFNINDYPELKNGMSAKIWISK
jgi:multidrug resistance efflux pump